MKRVNISMNSVVFKYLCILQNTKSFQVVYLFIKGCSGRNWCAKIFFTVFLSSFFSLFFPPLLFCSEVGNFFEPSILESGLLIPDTSFENIRTSALFDKVYKIKLESKREIEEALIKYQGYLGEVTVNLRDRMDFYVKLGEIHRKIKFTTNNIPKGKKNHGFYGVVGTKLLVIKIKNTGFGADVQYAMTDSFDFRQWQIAVGVSQRIWCFLPYAGVTFLGVQEKIRTPSQRARLENKNRIGIVSGLSLSSGSYLYLNAEVRCLNETGFSASIGIRF